MVYKTFLEHQFDFIYFVYGVSFFILAQSCFLAVRPTGRRPPWSLLGVFAALHGVNELLEMSTYNIGDSTAFAVIRLAVMAASFLFLLAFGLAGTGGTGVGKRGWLVLLPLLAISFTGVRWGLKGLELAVRYALGFTGGLWAAAAIYEASRAGANAGRSLRYAAAGMVLYAFAEGFVGPTASFFPASIVNYESFKQLMGFPVQLLKLFMVFSISISLTKSCRVRSDAGMDGGGWDRPLCSYRPLFMVLAILFAGWLITEAAGRHVESDERKNLLSRTLTAAASILPERVARLSGTPADEGRPEYEHLRADLQRIKAVNPDCRFVYLMGLRDDKEIFLVDAEPKGSKDYSRPGDVYPDATPREIADFKKGRPKVYEPYKDSWGTWVSGVSFINDPATGRVAAMFGMDIDADVWMHSVNLSRFFCMIITFVVSILGIVLYAAWYRAREAAEQSAALRLAEQRLANGKKLRDLTDSLGEGVIVQGADGLVSFANPEAERLLGWGAGELTGRPMDEAVGCCEDELEIIASGYRLADKALRTGETHREEDRRFTRRDGSRLAVSFVSSPIFEDGKVVGAVMAFQDITARKDIERQKDDFYAMVTHDLKSPLTLIQGYSDLLLDKGAGALDEASAGMLKNIQASGRKMLDLVNDFLTVARLEAGKLSLNEGLEDAGRILREALAEFAPVADKKKIVFEVNAPPVLPRVVCDRLQVQRALSNLVQNALHYCPPGGSVTVKADTAVVQEKEFFVVEVSDTGPGIPPEDRQKVFERYYRSARTAGLKGSGLGLAIVKAVATAHGGRVELDSSEGEGATFRLHIPTKRN